MNFMIPLLMAAIPAAVSRAITIRGRLRRAQRGHT